MSPTPSPRFPLSSQVAVTATRTVPQGQMTSGPPAGRTHSPRAGSHGRPSADSSALHRDKGIGEKDTVASSGQPPPETGLQAALNGVAKTQTPNPTPSIGRARPQRQHQVRRLWPAVLGYTAPRSSSYNTAFRCEHGRSPPTRGPGWMPPGLTPPHGRVHPKPFSRPPLSITEHSSHFSVMDACLDTPAGGSRLSGPLPGTS